MASEPRERDGLAARLARAAKCAITALSRLALQLSALAVLATFALICYAVGMRYFLGRPQPWVDEAAGWLIVISVMLAVPEAQRRGENIGVDVLTEKLTGRPKRILAAFGAATVAIVATLLITEGLEMVAFTRMLGLLSNNLPEIELWIIQSLVPLGGVLLLLVALAQLAAYVSGRPPQTVDERRAGPLE